MWCSFQLACILACGNLAVGVHGPWPASGLSSRRPQTMIPNIHHMPEHSTARHTSQPASCALTHCAQQFTHFTTCYIPNPASRTHGMGWVSELLIGLPVLCSKLLVSKNQSLSITVWYAHAAMSCTIYLWLCGRSRRRTGAHQSMWTDHMVEPVRKSGRALWKMSPGHPLVSDALFNSPCLYGVCLHRVIHLLPVCLMYRSLTFATLGWSSFYKPCSFLPVSWAQSIAMLLPFPLIKG